MSKLAIKGHPTRGKEVIELIEMFGGKNGEPTSMGGYINFIYFITSHGFIDFQDITKINIYEYEIFTLEEFEKKFPYKVGDRVRYNTKNGNIGDIISMAWDEKTKSVIYTVAFSHGYKELTVDKIIPYECNNVYEHIETSNNNAVTSVINLNRFDYADKVELNLNDYKIEVRNGKTYAILNGTKYPSTYAECCSILSINNRFSLTYDNVDNKYISAYEYQLMLDMDKLRKLKVCRDAYWKIAGEKMGLGKPWEPDWNDNKQLKFGIHTVKNQIRQITLCVLKNLILIFPTEEMRDAFYDNFKELIECCKEYL